MRGSVGFGGGLFGWWVLCVFVQLLWSYYFCLIL